MNDSVRVTFLLINGRRTDMTICGECAGNLTIEHYGLLWRKNLAGYMKEQRGDTSKFKQEFDNGILAEMGRVTWKEIVHGRQS